MLAPRLHRAERSKRLLTTVLFTDIVGSTERAIELGDRGWKDLVARHHAVVRRALARFGGRELDTAGDGFFATFERPAQAIECATEIIDDLRPLGLRIRAAIHMGEAEVMGDKVGGITVHVASRALAEAQPDEILVTSTVREVAAGADVTFTDRGVHEFKGVPEDWHLYAVEWRRREPATLPSIVSGAEAAGGRRRLGWRGVGGAMFLAAGLTALAAWLLAGGIAAPPVAQPDSAVRVDGATGVIGRVVPGLDTPTGVAMDGSTAWVLARGAKVLVGIPPVGATRWVGLSGPPTGIAAGDGAAWLTFGLGARGATEGIVLREATGTELDEQTVSVGYGAGGVALGERAVWVVNELDGTLLKLDPVTLSIRSAPVGSQPVAVAVGEGSVWVANALDRTIWRIDPVTLGRTAGISLVDPPTALALGFGRLWVTSSVGNSVAVIDPTTTKLKITIKVDGGPRGIAAGPDAMWVAASSGELLRIDPDPASLKVSPSLRLPGPAEGVAVSGQDVWVTVQR
jgi:YVTN family beta-propeller protein